MRILTAVLVRAGMHGHQLESEGDVPLEDSGKRPWPLIKSEGFDIAVLNSINMGQSRIVHHGKSKLGTFLKFLYIYVACACQNDLITTCWELQGT